MTPSVKPCANVCQKITYEIQRRATVGKAHCANVCGGEAYVHIPLLFSLTFGNTIRERLRRRNRFAVSGLERSENYALNATNDFQ
jgi:hypothetical protein